MQERLPDVCVQNNIVLRGILFMHRTIHKTTSRSANNHTIGLIDHNQSDVKTITSTRQRQTPPPYKNEPFQTIYLRNAHNSSGISEQIIPGIQITYT